MDNPNITTKQWATIGNRFKEAKKKDSKQLVVDTLVTISPYLAMLSQDLAYDAK